MSEPIDFQGRADAKAARKYKLLQATALLKLFERANGHPARDMTELNQWVATADIKRPIDPESVLSRSEIDAIVADLDTK